MNGFPQFDASGRVALVTGAALGLGRAISLALANAGADVALGLRDIKTDNGLPDEVRKMGRRLLPLQTDVTNLGQVSRAVEGSAEHLGRLDILVNNAGRGPIDLAEDIKEKDFDRTITINLKRTFFAHRSHNPNRWRLDRQVVVPSAGLGITTVQGSDRIIDSGCRERNHQTHGS
jgi:NAD(P)-dependent dehydrogenase (short-subunit alcohol dehydrogenase family)